ncbi:hypothetical protein EDD85DRAFT_782988 [Armillaria nabsnona]|nr:hypothetical protein EDD85DRAFT_782988 [Armillaria nabsnona]
MVDFHFRCIRPLLFLLLLLVLDNHEGRKLQLRHLLTMQLERTRVVMMELEIEDLLKKPIFVSNEPHIDHKPITNRILVCKFEHGIGIVSTFNRREHLQEIAQYSSAHLIGLMQSVEEKANLRSAAVKLRTCISMTKQESEKSTKPSN